MSILSPKVQNLLLYYISATVGSMVFKLMSSQYVDEGSHHRIFYHPYMQTFIMFLGQSLCLIIFLHDRKNNHLSLQEGKTPHDFTVFLIPSISDSMASILQYIALNFITPSSFRMFQGGSIITTLIFSKLLINMVVLKRHIWGCALAFLGLLIVGGSGFIGSQGSSGSSGNEFLGYILMIISLVFMGFHYSYQQMLMSKHSISPFQMVGWQGVFGLNLVLIISLIFSIVPCNLGEDLCVYDAYDHMYFERVDQFFFAVGSNWVVALLVFFGIISISASNLTGVRITKTFDALTLCLVAISKTPIIWAIGLIISFSTDDPNYQLESKDLAVSLVKIGGFCFIILGTLIYNKLILKKLLADEKQDDQIISNESNYGRLKSSLI